MGKFLALYSASNKAIEKMKKNKWQDTMNDRIAWKEKYIDSIVDFWWPISNTIKMTKKWISESKNKTIGYSIIKAESMNDANLIMWSCPHFNRSSECYLEVSEIMA